MKIKKILLKLRNQINEIDELILNLLSQRRTIAIKIAKEKIINNFPIKDKNREQTLLNKLEHIGKFYQLPTVYIQKIFQIIIEDSVMIQNKIKTTLNQKQESKQVIFSCLGPYGSYSHIACKKFIIQQYKNYIIKEYKNFKDIFSSILNKQSNYAMVPIENNTSGFIDEVYNLLCLKKLKIIGELFLPIQHCLLAKPNASLQTIQNIYSHEQGFKQCNKFFEKFPHWNIKYTNSTSEAMKIVSQKNKNHIAAIGDKSNAQFYQLHVILKNISNKKHNNTRFLILAKEDTVISDIKPNKTTILLKTPSNLLFDIILILHKKKVRVLQLKTELCYTNMIKENIYLEIQEHIKNNNVQNVLKIFKEKNILIEILGCYPTLNIL